MLSVPVDWDNPDAPDGEVAQLALLRIKAGGDKIGSLIVNPGGPGKSGKEAAAAMAATLPEEVRQRFDLVGFDPRGVAESTPAVWCNSDADHDRLRADNVVEYTPEGVAHLEKLTQEFVQRCVDKMGLDFLGNVGTESVVKDLDALRAALGDEQLTFLGYSYGTRIGAGYAEEYPQNVRAMILDGAIDPNADPVEADVRQAAAFQQAFDDYATDCAIDADCPLGTDPDKAVEVYQSLVWPLVDNPADTTDPRGLSYNDAVVGTILPLYSPGLWRHLTQALSEIEKGRATPCSRWPICTWVVTRKGITTTAPIRVSRSTASTSPRSPTAPRWSNRTDGSERPRRSCPTANSPVWPRCPRAVSGPYPRPAPHTRSTSTGCRRSWSSRPPTTRPPRTRPVSTWPASSTARW